MEKRSLCWEWQSYALYVTRIRVVSLMNIGNLLSAVVLLYPLAIAWNEFNIANSSTDH